MTPELERSRHVESERVLQDRDRHVHVRAELFDTASVVHQDVARRVSPLLFDDVAKCLDVCDVGGNRDCVASDRPDLIGDRVDVVLGPGDERHVGSRLGESQRDASADTLAGTRNQSGFFVEAKLLGDIRVVSQRSALMPKISAALPRQI